MCGRGLFRANTRSVFCFFVIRVEQEMNKIKKSYQERKWQWYTSKWKGIEKDCKREENDEKLYETQEKWFWEEENLCFSVPSEDKRGKYLKERREDGIREIQTSFVRLSNELGWTQKIQFFNPFQTKRNSWAKNEKSVIIYSPSCHSKPVWVSFLCWT